MTKRQSWDSQMIDGVFPTKVKDVDVAIKSEPSLRDVYMGELAKEVWNAAIEESALQSIKAIGYHHVANEIRKLKK